MEDKIIALMRIGMALDGKKVSEESLASAKAILDESAAEEETRQENSCRYHHFETLNTDSGYVCVKCGCKRPNMLVKTQYGYWNG